MIKISTRALQELLAGMLYQEVFIDRHARISGNENGPGVNLFEMLSKQGKVIKSTRVAADLDHDDDWIVFEFGNEDAAVARYRVPPDNG